MKEQKKYHQRKLAIIEMIESCEERIFREEKYIERNSFEGLVFGNGTSKNNIKRYESIKKYLTYRYNRQ